MGRRAFISQSAVLAAMAALVACGGADVGAGGGGAGGVTTPSPSTKATIKVSDYPELSQTGGVALVSIDGNPLAVVRTGTSTFVALSRVCPHAGSVVNTSTNGFLCPNHGARFNATGTWTGGQQTSNLRSYATVFDASAGTIAIG